MKLQFETLNKPIGNTKIAEFLYNETEEVFEKAFRADLEKVRDKLEGCEILIKIDFKNSNASFSGDNLSDEQMQIIENAIKK